MKRPSRIVCLFLSFSIFFSVVVHPVGCSYPANRSPPFSPDAGPPHPDGSEGLGAPHVPPKEMQSFIGQEHVLGVNTAALKKLTSKTFRREAHVHDFVPFRKIGDDNLFRSTYEPMNVPLNIYKRTFIF
ncbi:hypothetical protein OUZ56_000355 [Daphnia magna]|uniref:Uncharacterized protein n=1 Tax=Daphnia magna TaxID=35525 RepID=A0ABR0A075_9CRUS|nr:hypothetical protein OUZ56_000355 [Daphnia magna]